MVFQKNCENELADFTLNCVQAEMSQPDFLISKIQKRIN